MLGYLDHLLNLLAGIVARVGINKKVGRAIAFKRATCLDGIRSDERDVVAQDTAIQIAAGRRNSRIFQ